MSITAIQGVNLSNNKYNNRISFGATAVETKTPIKVAQDDETKKSSRKWFWGILIAVAVAAYCFRKDIAGLFKKAPKAVEEAIGKAEPPKPPAASTATAAPTNPPAPTSAAAKPAADPPAPVVPQATTTPKDITPAAPPAATDTAQAAAKTEPPAASTPSTAPSAEPASTAPTASATPPVSNTTTAPKDVTTPPSVPASTTAKPAAAARPELKIKTDKTDAAAFEHFKNNPDAKAFEAGASAEGKAITYGKDEDTIVKVVETPSGRKIITRFSPSDNDFAVKTVLVSKGENKLGFYPVKGKDKLQINLVQGAAAKDTFFANSSGQFFSDAQFKDAVTPEELTKIQEIINDVLK